MGTRLPDWRTRFQQSGEMHEYGILMAHCGIWPRMERKLFDLNDRACHSEGDGVKECLAMYEEDQCSPFEQKQSIEK